MNITTRYAAILFFLHSTYTFCSESVILADFEQQNLTVINKKENNPIYRYLWNQYDDYPSKGAQLGSERLSNKQAHTGLKSLNVTIERGNIYLQFFPKPTSSKWDFTYQHVPNQDWTFNKYNRLKFWVKLPPGIKKARRGKQNTTFGTYFRKRNGNVTSAEAGGNHAYHFYDLESSGEWHQIIVDTHPNHLRGVTGSREHGNMEFPTKEADFNYFDILTRFYFDMENNLPHYPAEFYFDNFEFYRAPTDENIKQVYSLHGVYVKSSNKVMIGWMRDKNENKITHEVRYAFHDIHTIGWDLALKAPGGFVKPSGWGGHNGMEYTTNKIIMQNQQILYLAIKPENSDKFRQIEIPLNNL
jgi:hypothetical protein